MALLTWFEIKKVLNGRFIDKLSFIQVPYDDFPNSNRTITEVHFWGYDEYALNNCLRKWKDEHKDDLSRLSSNDKNIIKNLKEMDSTIDIAIKSNIKSKDEIERNFDYSDYSKAKFNPEHSRVIKSTFKVYIDFLNKISLDVKRTIAQIEPEYFCLSFENKISDQDLKKIHHMLKKGDLIDCDYPHFISRMKGNSTNPINWRGSIASCGLFLTELSNSKSDITQHFKIGASIFTINEKRCTSEQLRNNSRKTFYC